MRFLMDYAKSCDLRSRSSVFEIKNRQITACTLYKGLPPIFLYLLITLVLLMLSVEPRGFDFFLGCCIFHSLFAAINIKPVMIALQYATGNAGGQEYNIMKLPMLSDHQQSRDCNLNEVTHLYCPPPLQKLCQVQFVFLITQAVPVLRDRTLLLRLHFNPAWPLPNPVCVLLLRQNGITLQMTTELY